MTIRPCLIGIAGGSGAGKSALSVALAETLSAGGRPAAVLPLDAYYHDLSHLPPGARARQNFDHPDAIDQVTALSDLQALAAGQTVHRPVYDFATHRRRAETVRVGGVSHVIVEGLLALYWPAIRELLAVRVFLTADEDVCLARRVNRDVRERRRSESGVRRQWRSTVRDMTRRYVEPTRVFADATFQTDGSLHAVLTELKGRFGW